MALLYRQGTAPVTFGTQATGRMTLRPAGAAALVITATGRLNKFATPFVTAAALNDTTVRVTFSQPMANNAALSLLSNYVFTAPLGAPALTPFNVVPQGIAEPTYVDITVDEMLDDGVYTITTTNLQDTYDNAVTGVNAATTFAGSGTRPTVTVAVASDAHTLRVTFDGAMDPATLGSILAYSVEPVTSGAALVYVEGVLVPDTPTVMFVDLLLSEMTNGATYNVRVSPDIGPTDAAGNHVEDGSNEYNFTGVGGAPAVQQVIAIGANRVDVIFSEPMRDNADIRDKTKYAFDNGLLVLAVLGFDNDTVKLSTTDQTPGVLYTLTVG